MVVYNTLGSYQPKAMTAFLSGEMKDTVELNPTGAYGEAANLHIDFD